MPWHVWNKCNFFKSKKWNVVPDCKNKSPSINLYGCTKISCHYFNLPFLSLWQSNSASRDPHLGKDKSLIKGADIQILWPYKATSHSCLDHLQALKPGLGTCQNTGEEFLSRWSKGDVYLFSFDYMTGVIEHMISSGRRSECRKRLMRLMMMERRGTDRHKSGMRRFLGKAFWPSQLFGSSGKVFR